MSLIDDLQKEEFQQSYLQYRWLDDTRCKFIDRFFVVIIALIAARFQFSDFFEKRSGWTLGLYLFLVFFSAFMARSIVYFRRQQRGHSEYIKKIREMILTSDTSKEDGLAGYRNFIKGEKVYPTKWVEIIVLIVAFLSPLFLIFDPIVTTQTTFVIHIPPSFCCIVFPIILMLAILYFVGFPFCRYTIKKSLDWKKD